MEKYLSVTLKLPVDVHTKLKVMSALSNKSMTKLIIEWVEKQKVKAPYFMEPGEIKKPVKVAAVADDVLKETILKYKAEGMTLQSICDKLDADGISTARGGSWNKGTLSNMLKRWEG